jgi:hypothetical protein
VGLERRGVDVLDLVAGQPDVRDVEGPGDLLCDDGKELIRGAFARDEVFQRLERSMSPRFRPEIRHEPERRSRSIDGGVV